MPDAKLLNSINTKTIQYDCENVKVLTDGFTESNLCDVSSAERVPTRPRLLNRDFDVIFLLIR